MHVWAFVTLEFLDSFPPVPKASFIKALSPILLNVNRLCWLAYRQYRHNTFFVVVHTVNQGKVTYHLDWKFLFLYDSVSSICLSLGWKDCVVFRQHRAVHSLEPPEVLLHSPGSDSWSLDDGSSLSLSSGCIFTGTFFSWLFGRFTPRIKQCTLPFCRHVRAALSYIEPRDVYFSYYCTLTLQGQVKGQHS